MSLIKFNNIDKIFDVDLKTYKNGDYLRAEMTFNENDIADFNEEILSNGFVELNEHNHFIQGEHNDKIHLYKKSDDGLTYILTNNEDDVYVEPTEPENPDVDYDYTPSLESVKDSKINSLSRICNTSIIDGVDVEIDGNVEHFSYTEEDQMNIKEIFDLAVQSNISMYYHADGQSCKLYTVEQIVNIYTSLAMNKMHHITYFNQLKMFIQSLEDVDAVNNIEYGVELTGEYLEIYNAAMEQAKAGMNALLTVDAVEV